MSEGLLTPEPLVSEERIRELASAAAMGDGEPLPWRIHQAIWAAVLEAGEAAAKEAEQHMALFDVMHAGNTEAEFRVNTAPIHHSAGRMIAAEIRRRLTGD